MSPESGYIRKSSVRWFVLGLFAFLLGVNALGLTLVKNYAADQAAQRATRTALAANEATRYASNKSACGIRALIDPTVKAEKATRLTYVQSLSDPKTSAAARARNRTRITVIDKQLKAQAQVRETFGTIPPDFDCRTLPDNPPPFSEG